MHLFLEVMSAVIAIIPLTALVRAYRQTPSPRIALALLAFAILEVRLLSMIAIHTVLLVDHFTEELIEFGGDFAVIAAFGLAFLHGTRWSPERSAARVA